MRLAINENQCTLYNEQTGQTLMGTTLHVVVHRANAYPKLIEFVRDIANTDRNKANTKAVELLLELGERLL